ncbi:hypothetical protein M0R45_016890 [Rubus argutus]|uniref:Uncharacterized protein n=1 Tax=Rubus argutus TaxID=59490 RepID=A0AAW1XUK8_RUBAR
MDDRTDGDDLQAILAEQRRELLAAKTLDSDLDMAFNPSNAGSPHRVSRSQTLVQYFAISASIASIRAQG